VHNIKDSSVTVNNYSFSY